MGLSISVLLTDENGIEYDCCANTKIKITEHFAEDGNSMGELLEDLIIREAKKAAKDQRFKSLHSTIESDPRL